ncbi:MAG: hypothetical protein IIC95_10515 [Chloroflexi bacterium]|nr:hypothetical protein [Chloroflexota bacterium]
MFSPLLSAIYYFLRHAFVTEFEMDHLPSGCEETRLGWNFGATRQWRGLDGLHVREHDGQLIGHYDRIDPRTNLLGHLVLDMPKEMTIALSTGVGLVVFFNGGAAPALLWGGIAGAGALLTTFAARRARS